MQWETAARYDTWGGNISNREAKEKVGRHLAARVREGDVIGVGSGSTSYVALHAIAERVKREGLSVTAVCTSAEGTLSCAAIGIPTVTLFERRPDWYFDGADEVDPANDLIKGRGGALFREKLVMSASPETYILVDESKLVPRLGTKFPVPVEVFPPALHLVDRALEKLGATEMALRPAGGKDGPVITESGNLILDVRFAEIGAGLEREIKTISGVIESGLFQGRAVTVITPERL